MQKNGFVRLNTTLKPPPGVAEAVIVLSKDVDKEHTAFFVLDDKHFFPHVTVYSPEYPRREQAEVLSRVEKLAASTPKLTLKYVHATSSQGYIGLQLASTDSVRSLHEQLVEKLNPLRGGRLRDKYREDASDYHVRFSAKQKENIKNYGYPGAMALYRPHMTVIRLKNEQEAQKVAEKLSWVIGEMTFVQIGVYAMGEHGTCTKELAVFDLQRP